MSVARTICLFLILSLPSLACINPTDSRSRSAQDLEQLFQDFPKGANLHMHLDGAVYAETLLDAEDIEQFCLNPKTYTVSHDNACVNQVKLSELSQYPLLYRQTLEQWSMLNFDYSDPSLNRHDHFFNAFAKFINLSWGNRTTTMKDVLTRAARDNVSYLEIMDAIDNNGAGILGASIPYQSNFDEMIRQLQHINVQQLMTQTHEQVTQLRQTLNKDLNCFNPLLRKRACDVEYRFIYQVMREQEPNQVFAAMYLGFELAKLHPDVVGINMVQPEDGRLAIRDYRLHMKMLDYFHKRYPTVQITLHAGELIPGLVAKKELNFHINEAVHTGHAKRIGHGVSILHERRVHDLLRYMHQNGIMVEINLSSNDAILNVKGAEHAIHTYLKHGVPVALSTDDEGLLRTTINKEYQKAFTEHKLDMNTLMQLSRNSLTYSFLPGNSLWNMQSPTTLHPSCTMQSIQSLHPNRACARLLNSSKKARLQWRLEQKLARFKKIHYGDMLIDDSSTVE